jgi:hypothetical protein
MDWIILFIISWAFFFLVVDWKRLKVNIWCGLLAVLLQTAVDSQAISHKLYNINNPVIDIWGSSLLFVLGPVFVIGTLLAQFHPSKKWLILANVAVVSGLFSLEELFLIVHKDLIYTNWHYNDSIVVNICAMTVLSWFSIVILNSPKKEGR